MKKIVSLLLTAIITSGTCIAKDAEDWVIHAHEAHQLDTMSYRLLRPIQFDKSQSYPVIVSLHGAGGRGTDNVRQLRTWNAYLAEETVRTDYPCYVVAPQSEERWSASSLKAIQAIIAGLESVDMNRIYITGFSMGGHGTYTLTQLAPDYFAAAAPAAGTGLKSSPTVIDISIIKDIPFWAFHGSEDPKCPIENQQKVFDDMKAIGGNMKFTIWDGDRHSGKTALKTVAGGDNGTTYLSSERCDTEPVFMKWLFAQSKSKG